MFNLLSRSYHWRKIRSTHLKKEKRCKACASKKNLHVHHIIPVNVDRSKEFEETNLITLCKTCHFVFGHLMDWNSWNTEVIQDCEVYYNKIVNKPRKFKVQFYDKNNIGNFMYSLWNKFCSWYYRS